MAIDIGDIGANSGLTKEIYDVLDGLLRPKMEDQLEPDQIPDVIPPAQESWRELSHAIATGVVNHLRQGGPNFAEVISSEDEDSDFWDFWQGLAVVLRDWANSGGTPVDLQSDLQSHFSSNDIPDEMRGRIR